MTLWLEELYLEPEYRGCGIGGSYFEFVKSEFGGKVKRIRLEVGPETSALSDSMSATASTSSTTAR